MDHFNPKRSLWTRAAALLCCAVLVLGLAAPAAGAEESVIFTAMGESILPLTDATMPFVSGNSIFLPADIFTDAVRRSLDVSYTYNAERGLMVLYRGSHALWFDLSTDYATDEEDTVYYPGATVKNGHIFVSATLVARFFSLSYSVTEVPHGYMVWFRKADYPLSDIRFADAASYNMESRYQEYLRSRETAATPEEPVPVQPPEDTVMDGKRIYLCFQAGRELEAMLDVLDRAGTQAAAFFTPEKMASSGSALRRMTASGHSIGILVDAAAEEGVLAQAARANDALAEDTCTRTRLVMVQNSTDEARRLLTEAGYCVVMPDMDRTRYALRSADQAENLVRRISERQGSVTVWLGDSASSYGLRLFLDSAAQAEGRCRALSETA